MQLLEMPMSEKAERVYKLDSEITEDQHRAALEHIAEKYLERALEDYNAARGTAEEPKVMIAMINSLADRLAMVEARAKKS